LRNASSPLTTPTPNPPYVRRLALALDLPSEAVAHGASIRVHKLYSRYGLTVSTRWPHVFVAHVPITDGSDEPPMLLALARAWPADKRVGR
jgi:hypothetical protein